MGDDHQMSKNNGGVVACHGVVVSKRKSKVYRHRLITKCAALVKEQRARLYILRRCATMLCCSYIHGSDD